MFFALEIQEHSSILTISVKDDNNDAWHWVAKICISLSALST